MSSLSSEQKGFIYSWKFCWNFSCGLIALGNGTACRETEAWLTKLFEANILDKRRVKYSIVAEQGASIYSCGEIAKKEFPKMDVNLISAGNLLYRDGHGFKY